MRVFLATIISMSVVSALAKDESWKPPFDYAAEFPTMVAPFEPFRIVGNLYYVGTEGLAVYLIAGVNGHVLIDGGMPGYEQVIIDNIAELGFDIKAVKYLLNTHAHFDHSGGLAKLKESSGASLIASEGDVSALEGGFYLGSESNTNFNAPPVEVDHIMAREFADHPTLIVSVGRTQSSISPLRSELTPGHTRGCTSWRLSVEEVGKEFDVLIFCSATVAANRLVPEQYDGIIEDYRLTFHKTKDWSPDVFLANHPEAFFMKEAREKQKAGDPLAFVNRGAFQKYIAEKERAFERALEEQIRQSEQ